MTPREIAHAMMNHGSAERREAERMMGKLFEQMTKDEKVLCAECLSAFENVWRKPIGEVV